MAATVNIAAYKFVPLTNLKSLRERLLALCKQWELKGTILLSTEGINLFVAGEQSNADRLLAELRSIPGLAELQPKVSASARQPFTRMLVRIKKEIIAFGVDGIAPERHTSPKLAPHELKRWLDEGRPVTLLDTRNDYEVKLGTFRGALSLGIDHFRDFPTASAQLPAELKQQPVVMFCTGGIRCEKAGPFLEREGFQQIFQLDGGILKYFEECGGAHYDGECFVFDQRVGLDPGLKETSSDQCYVCLTPLSTADQGDARFVKGVSCPYCHETSDEQRERTLRARQQALRVATTPLPGSRPYDNYRPIKVPASCDGRPLLELLCEVFSFVPREQWQSICAAGQLCDNDKRPIAADHIVRAGERYLHVQPATIEPDVSIDIQIVYEDEALIVVHKPAPLPLHPCGRFNRNTLQSFLQTVYEPQKPRPAHRLDANTSGLVVFTRTRHFASLVQPQFEYGEVEKTYLARVQGHPPEDQFACDAPISAEALETGLRAVDEAAGLPARTEFRVLKRLADGTTLLEVRPLTGRTNQIRVHLWQLGWPIVGDQSYLANRQHGETQTGGVDDPPLCLFAKSITFVHPISGERTTFSAEAPAWAADAL
ncbi:MAG: RluA family pseudouridine synthase [Planctomycetes bacterium]|nr:RluA family pseudouridine synthase [Planctomycetota bacterium]